MNGICGQFFCIEIVGLARAQDVDEPETLIEMIQQPPENLGFGIALIGRSSRRRHRFFQIVAHLLTRKKRNNGPEGSRSEKNLHIGGCPWLPAGTWKSLSQRNSCRQITRPRCCYATRCGHQKEPPVIGGGQPWQR